MIKIITNKFITIFLTVILAPVIAAYCLLWAAMTIGGGTVKRILKKDAA